MSNIGKKPVEVKEGVSVQVNNSKVVVTGPKGTLETKMPYGISVVLEEGKAKVRKENETPQLDMYSGLVRSLVANMITGVTSGFEKKLELNGVGFRAKVEGDTLVLNVGFAVPVRIKAPNGISMKVDENIITVSGIDKELVGNIASIIKRVKIPDPYKAKGIKYVGERIRRKVGKAAKAVGGK
ncbi:MAG: 50S ribosomal protein L6 [Candidatus Levybacteria bacterium RIFCSPHIGHO2_01_FULL_36_15]|nr:MAG: 50S ribosomal protein L6 [Candidatus Levybacteria bacterium RIFCSPHIGHO2_01_FULL_36_15]OGH38368.1 MAG: 50S ribosomal protein L6 [Candidatus Levybacteria bacterium RIFCSPLOWO2_01_FULL_36_10]